MKGSNLAILLVVVLATGLLSLYVVSALQPNGASVTPGTPQTSPGNTTAPGQNNAMAGNITELTVVGKAVTQAWQGYFGNVSGTIELADATGDVMYNWTGLTDPTGEVYASTNATIAWANIQCFNFTANGSMATSGESAGATNVAGMNLTQLEDAFNIADDDGDGVDITFTDANSHAEFFTANLNFTVGECLSTDVFDSSGEGTDGTFEEVLLYEPTTASVVFTALLESDASGFDSNPHDFEMLVLEDGHSGDGGSTTYYFFAEIE